MLRYFLSVCLFLFCIHLTVVAQQSPTCPSWIEAGNIYEVNVRQYTPEGTFKAFEKHLPRLKKMGVQTLWFMPLSPIGIKDRKGSLGSYYAIKNYKAVNSEFGSWDDWKKLVTTCHNMGFKVIIDWVANHTSADHDWLQTKKSFYVLDSTGQAVTPFDWTDARKLNYSNEELQDSMISIMMFWLKESNIDGFRCDVAEEVPAAFWKKCIQKLRTHKNIFMLAEGEKPWLHEAGFNATYTWSVFNVIKDIASGKSNTSQLDSILDANSKSFPSQAARMYFTSNHDENSWNKADFGTTPNEKHAPFAVFSQTIKQTIPLIYSGQEEPFLRAIRFFDKDTITFKSYKREKFYQQLLSLRKQNEALKPYAGYLKLQSSQPNQVFAYLRYTKNKKVLVLLNLSNNATSVNCKHQLLQGLGTEIFSNKQKSFKGLHQTTLKPWGYEVYSF